LFRFDKTLNQQKLKLIYNAQKAQPVFSKDETARLLEAGQVEKKPAIKYLICIY
jgi:hypothetical protein